MNTIAYIKIVTLSFLALSVVAILFWIFRPNSKKLYKSISKIPLDNEKKQINSKKK
jgi:cbb3-type cytochrome oxidase subunit 3